jgi:hypothetical protein
MMEDNTAGVIRDHLGEIYEIEGQSEKGFSQYFTPMPLCELMASLTIDENAPEDARIADPACGTGRLLLACIKHRPRGYYMGIDVDRVMAVSCALNLLWRNVRGDVIWGNTLSLQARGGWTLSSTALGGQIRCLPVERAQALLEASVRGMEAAAEKSLPIAVGNETPPIIVGKLGKRGQFEMDF